MESINGKSSHSVEATAPRLKVLLTGPSGRVGPHLTPDFEARFDLRTFDLRASDKPNSFVGDLSSIEDLRKAMHGVDVVVHLAATSDEAPFVEQLVPNNVVGLYNVFEAARLEKVRRVVFASSVQVVGRALNQAPEAIETDEVRPNSLYGATKAFGEVMGRWYHDHHGIEFIGMRIGWFQTYDEKLQHQGNPSDIWLSPRDLLQLVRRAVEVPGIGYAVVNGTSIPVKPRLSLDSARAVLGFEPEDDTREFMAEKIAVEV